jgi:hypothetical protein
MYAFVDKSAVFELKKGHEPSLNEHIAKSGGPESSTVKQSAFRPFFAFCGYLMRNEDRKMSKYFMRGTPRAGFEIMMMIPPNYNPRGGGMLVNHKYTAADCDCRYCVKTEKKKPPCRTAEECVCFEERLEAGCWTLSDLAGLLAKEIAVSRLTGRISRLLPQTSIPFKDEAHRKRMTSVAAAMTRESTPFTAAVFLLSADPALWRSSRLAVCNGTVDFGKINVRGMAADSYTLLQTAKDLYHGGCRLTTEDLCDTQVISDRMFRLIVSAFVIRRYGLPSEKLS